LDFATSGVLLLTNDTKLAAYLTEPSNHIVRTYVVTVRGKVTETDLEKIRVGIQDDGEVLQTQAVVLRKSSAKESHLTIQLTEGKNREIRRIFLSLGHEVTRLKRVAYGELELGDLAGGDYREVTMEELKRCFPGAPLRADLAF
jgi:23S rRNA pseudouridine2605 synthase